MIYLKYCLITYLILGVISYFTEMIKEGFNSYFLEDRQIVTIKDIKYIFAEQFFKFLGHILIGPIFLFYMFGDIKIWEKRK